MKEHFLVEQQVWVVEIYSSILCTWKKERSPIQCTWILRKHLVMRGKLSSLNSMFTVCSYTLPSDANLPMGDTNCADLDISEDDVLEILSCLDPDKAMGLDGIGPKFLKYCALAIYQPLHHLFLTFLHQHKIPTEWKIHCISPTHKSGDKASVSNCRPISLLGSTSKVMECLVYNKCNGYIEGKLSSTQFGFRPSHSTVFLPWFTRSGESVWSSWCYFLGFCKSIWYCTSQPIVV